MKTILTKTCSRCKINKHLDSFGKLSKSKDGLRSSCKDCRKLENKTEKQKELAKIRSNKWLEKNPQYSSTYSTSDRGKEKRRARFKKFYEQNREKFTNKQRLKRQTDPHFKLASNLRSRVWSALKGTHKSKRTIELIGCSIEELWKYLESKFQHGMTKNNYGEWHVDHIIPCCKFDMNNLEDQKKCFHYTNLQPLWAIDNLRKSGS
jgi:hypothetical protein